MAALPALVMSPVVPLTEKLVPAISFAPIEIAVPIVASETSIAVVIPPPPEEVILRPIGRARSESALSIKTNWEGLEVPIPSALTNLEPPVESVAVVTTKLESVAVSVRVNEIFLLLVVSIVFPALYAACNEIDVLSQVTTLFDPSTQRIVPTS